MPYIKSKQKDRFASLDVALEINTVFTNPGELNWLLTKCCLSYLNSKEENYQTYNDIIGVLECCKLEMYRRKIAKYEDKKIAENGDVY